MCSGKYNDIYFLNENNIWSFLEGMDMIRIPLPVTFCMSEFDALSVVPASSDVGFGHACPYFSSSFVSLGGSAANKFFLRCLGIT